MAAANVTLRDISPDFAAEFLRDDKVSSRSRGQGIVRTRYCKEGYIHKVCLCRPARVPKNATENASSSEVEPDTIEVSGRCYRSQRKSEKPHSIVLTVEEHKKITDNFCTCMAGASGYCSHAVGLVFTIENWLADGLMDIPDDVSSTSVAQTWNVPRGPKIKPEAITKVVIANPMSQRKRRPVASTVQQCSTITATAETFEFLGNLEGYPISYLANQQMAAVSTLEGLYPLGSGLSYQLPQINRAMQHATEAPTKAICGDLHVPRCLPFPNPNQVFLTSTITQDLAEMLEATTRAQRSSEKWFRERQGRITASNFGLVCQKIDILNKFPDKTVSESLFKTVYASKGLSTVATRYGVDNEAAAITQYEILRGVHVHPCGLVINPAIPFLGASPDGLVCDSLQVGTVEIKCPYTARDMTPASASGMIKDFFLELSPVTGELTLKHDHAYYYQVQGQLMVTGLPFGDFVTYTPHGVNVERIYPDVEFMQTMYSKLYQFHHGFGVKYLKID